MGASLSTISRRYACNASRLSTSARTSRSVGAVSLLGVYDIDQNGKSEPLSSYSARRGAGAGRGGVGAGTGASTGFVSTLDNGHPSFVCANVNTTAISLISSLLGF